MRFNRILYISIVLNLLFMVTFVMLIDKKGGIPYLQSKMSMAKPLHSNESLINNPHYILKKDMFNAVPISSTSTTIVMLGDSITEGCEWSELLQDNSAKNRGIGGDTVYGVLNRLDDIIALKPNKIFLMCGINDLSLNRPPEQIIDDYNSILKKLVKDSPNSKVFIQSILPTNNDIYSNENIKNNDKVVALNSEIKELSIKYNLRYVDLYNAMKTQDGKLNRDVTIDGLHLNGKGYRVWKEVIKEYI